MSFLLSSMKLLLVLTPLLFSNTSLAYHSDRKLYWLLKDTCQESRDRLKSSELKYPVTSREFLTTKYRIYLDKDNRFNSCRSDGYDFLLKTFGQQKSPDDLANLVKDSFKTIDQLTIDDLTDEFCLAKALKEEPVLAEEIKNSFESDKLKFFGLLCLITFYACIIIIGIKYLFIKLFSKNR